MRFARDSKLDHATTRNDYCDATLGVANRHGSRWSKPYLEEWQVSILTQPNTGNAHSVASTEQPCSTDSPRH